MLEGDAERREWTLNGPHLTGFSVYHAIRDPRDGTLYAATNFFERRGRPPLERQRRDVGARRVARPARGPRAQAQGRLARRARRTATSGSAATRAALPLGGRATTWQSNEGLLHHDARALDPGAGGICLHSIRSTGRPDRMVSASPPPACSAPTTAARPGSTEQADVRPTSCPTRIPRSGSACTSCSSTRPGPSASGSRTTAASTAPTTGAHVGALDGNGLPSGFGFALALDPERPGRRVLVPEQAREPRHRRAGGSASTGRGTAAPSWELLGERPPAAGLDRRAARG